MSKLEQAMEAAQARKMAVTSDSGGVVMFDTDFAERAIFSGFDIEHGELTSTAENVADYFCNAIYCNTPFGLRALFSSAWCDGLLTGLLLASLPPTPESGDSDPVTGQGGDF